MKKKKQLLGLSLLLIGIALFLFPFLSMIKEDIGNPMLSAPISRPARKHSKNNEQP